MNLTTTLTSSDQISRNLTEDKSRGSDNQQLAIHRKDRSSKSGRTDSRGIPHFCSPLLGFRRRPRSLHTKTDGQVVTRTTLKPEKLGGVEGRRDNSPPKPKEMVAAAPSRSGRASDYTELRNYTSQKPWRTRATPPHFRIEFGVGAWGMERGRGWAAKYISRDP